MPQIINTNVASLNAQRNLDSSQADANKALQRLSSGLRINSAKDDAAGLAISNRLTSQINGINQAIRNANDGISVAQVAEGALGETTNILQRMRELSIQSANASNSADDRAALQAEVDELILEVDRIAESTAFGATKLLNGSYLNQQFQVGAQRGETISVSIASAAAEQLGALEDIDFAGYNTALTTQQAPAAAATTYTTADNGIAAQVLTLSVDGATNTIGVTTGEAVDSIADKINNLAVGVTADAESGARITIAGTLTAETSTGADNGDAIAFDLTVGGQTINLSFDRTTAGAAANAQDIATQFAADISSDLETNNVEGVTVTVSGGAISLLDDQGRSIQVGNADYTDGNTNSSLTSISVQALDSNGAVVAGSEALNLAAATDDGVNVFGTLNFTVTDPSAEIDVALETDTVAGNITTAGSAAAGAGTVVLDPSNAVSSIDISTVAGANNALDILDAALTGVDSQRADLGAAQNRLESVISNLANVAENSAAARSRIRDADFAQETAALSKSQILQQAGISVLAQANASTQNVLALLQ